MAAVQIVGCWNYFNCNTLVLFGRISHIPGPIVFFTSQIPWQQMCCYCEWAIFQDSVLIFLLAEIEFIGLHCGFNVIKGDSHTSEIIMCRSLLYGLYKSRTKYSWEVSWLFESVPQQYAKDWGFHLHAHLYTHVHTCTHMHTQHNRSKTKSSDMKQGCLASTRAMRQDLHSRGCLAGVRSPVFLYDCSVVHILCFLKVRARPARFHLKILWETEPRQIQILDSRWGTASWW